ncbi:hypothetical protein [Streptomyces sp. NPDC006285]|uniref:hypothetical protein n=1 Tax=Streptomyces sp. NPDC006285 TaxID=3364742 RepID=UPI00367C90CB
MSTPHEPPSTMRSLAPVTAAATTGRKMPPPLVVRYLILGLIMGGLWAWHAGAPLWEHAVRLLALLLIGPPLLHRARARRRRRLGLEGEPRLSLVRLTLLKLWLVALALLAAWVLNDRLSGADYWIAGGLTVITTVFGPPAHPHLIVTTDRPSSRRATRT